MVTPTSFLTPHKDGKTAVEGLYFSFYYLLGGGESFSQTTLEIREFAL